MTKVLITGGSEGIGYEFAKIYAAQGASLFLCARDMVKLHEARGALQNVYHRPVKIISCDLSMPGSAQKLFDEVKDENIDVLINCAGFGFTGESWKIDVEQEEKMVMVNDASLMSLCKLFASQMRQRKSGVILNIASTGGLFPGPYIAGYYASKAFVISYTKAIAKELKASGVRVYCLCPGPVATAFYHKEGLKIPRGAMRADQCAAYAMEHMKKNVMIIPGFVNRLCTILPASWRTAFIARQKKKILDRA